MSPAELQLAVDRLLASRVAQGFAPKCADPSALATIAAALGVVSERQPATSLARGTPGKEVKNPGVTMKAGSASAELQAATG